jgi:hypothetical protein
MEGTRERILVVEDDLPLLEAMVRLLSAEGYEVAGAGSGDECLRLAMDFLPDLVLLDVVLPDADGRDICLSLKGAPELRDAHVLLVSGVQTDPGEQAMALQAGADGFLVKPVDEEELAARVAVALRRRRGEMELRAQRDLLQKVIDAIPNPVFIKDREGVYVNCNRAFEEYLGLESERILSRTVYEVAPPELAEKYHQADQELFASPGRQTYEAQVAYADGTLRDVIFYKSTFEGAGGGLAGLVGVILDITPRKRAEKELQRERDRLSSYLEVAGVMVVVLDAEGRVELVNRKGCEILGYSEGELLGRDWFGTCLPERAVEDVRRIFEQLLRGEVGEAEYVEQAVLTRSGEERIISWHNAVLYAEDGSVSGTLSSGEDVTERVRRERELESLNRDLRAFASTLSHDLKGPLGNAYGYAATLRRLYGDRLDETGREGLEVMESSLSKINDIIDGMLSYARAGREKRPDRRFDLALLVDGVLDELRQSQELAGVEVRVQAGLPVVTGDPVRLAQVLRNLLGNAAKYSSDGSDPLIEVGMVETGMDRAVYIRDNGPGISRDELDNLFEPLFRGEGARDVPGHGLGLAIVRRAVESWGGRTWVESEPGRGSTFFFSLPG